MQLLTEKEYPTIYNCGMLSLAMVLGTEPEYLYKHMPEPNSLVNGVKRGFLYCDAQAYCVNSNRILGLIEMTPMTAEGPVMGELPALLKMELFLAAIKDRLAILCSDSHAVAWDGKKCFDPAGAGRIFEMRSIQGLEFNPQEAWILGKL